MRWSSNFYSPGLPSVRQGELFFHLLTWKKKELKAGCDMITTITDNS